MTPEGDELSGHEKFRMLAAIATSGELTAAETAELRAHLSGCEACRELYREYRVLAKDGMSTFGAGYERQDWDREAVRRKLLGRVRAAGQGSTAPGWVSWTRKYLLPALAACLVIAVGAGALLYERPPDAQAASRLRDLAAENQTLRGSLDERTLRLAELQQESSEKEQQMRQMRSRLEIVYQRAAALAKLKAGAEERVAASLQQHDALRSELATARAAADEQLRAARQQRDTLSARLHELQQSAHTVEAELSRLQSERDTAVLRVTALARQATELSAAKAEQDRRLKNQEQYLAADRHIRDLIGASQLYIADVFDVSSDSRTRRPYGRIFYTKGKSLIFYAFDLDRQPRVAGATFQAWGRKEAFEDRPLKLGILYLDNEANRRWLLRCDDPKQLAEIDAVFVTVEPRGGSEKPTGKPFLYASLRREINHP